MRREIVKLRSERIGKAETYLNKIESDLGFIDSGVQAEVLTNEIETQANLVKMDRMIRKPTSNSAVQVNVIGNFKSEGTQTTLTLHPDSG